MGKIKYTSFSQLTEAEKLLESNKKSLRDMAQEEFFNIFPKLKGKVNFNIHKWRPCEETKSGYYIVISRKSSGNFSYSFKVYDNYIDESNIGETYYGISTERIRQELRAMHNKYIKVTNNINIKNKNEDDINEEVKLIINNIIEFNAMI